MKLPSLLITVTISPQGALYYNVMDVARCHRITRKSPTKSPAPATVPLTKVITFKKAQASSNQEVFLDNKFIGWLTPTSDHGFFFVDDKHRTSPSCGLPGLTPGSDHPYPDTEIAAMALRANWPAKYDSIAVVVPPQPKLQNYSQEVLDLLRRKLISPEKAAELLKG